MRPLIRYIHLDNLRDNYRYLKGLHGNKLLAVIKADAYGHGAVACAHALHDIADGFAVASLDEALELRFSGITLPIVLLEGVFTVDEYAAVDHHNLWPVIQCDWQLQAFLRHPWQTPPKVWLKMDTGMHRAGFDAAGFRQAFASLTALKNHAGIVKMTHLARADEIADCTTATQIAAIESVHDLSAPASVANSAGILYHRQSHYEWGRAGIALYGIAPVGISHPKLKPVMTLKTQVFAEKTLYRGDLVGYGGTYRVEEESLRVGIIACGYADGYPRHIPPAGTPILIQGQKSEVIGRVSMDMMTVRLPEHEGVGAEVELWGEALSINAIAEAAGTISYELLTHIKRAEPIYLP